MELILLTRQAYEEIQKHFKHFAEELKQICDNRENLSTWLDNQQVCQLLSISKRTLQYYREKGMLPSSQIGNKCYYKKSDIELILVSSYHINKKHHGNKR